MVHPQRHQLVIHPNLSLVVSGSAILRFLDAEVLQFDGIGQAPRCPLHRESLVRRIWMHRHTQLLTVRRTPESGTQCQEQTGMCQAKPPSYAPSVAPSTHEHEQQMALHKQERHHHRPCRRRRLALQPQRNANRHHHAQRQPGSLARKHESGTHTMPPAAIHHRHQHHPQRQHQHVERKPEYTHRETTQAELQKERQSDRRAHHADALQPLKSLIRHLCLHIRL